MTKKDRIFDNSVAAFSASVRAFKFIRLMLFDPFGITISYKIQFDVMLEQRFEPGEHQGKPLSRISHLFHKFITGAGESSLCNGNEGRAIFLRRERPFHGGGTAVSRPLNEDALVLFDDFRSHRD